jgi:hypothetical protein
MTDREQFDLWCGYNGQTPTASKLHVWQAATAAALAAPAHPERKPMTDKEIAGAIARSPDPMAFGKLPAEGWRPMVRLVEAFHDITKLAPTGSELPSKQADQMEVTSQGQVPAWHDAPTAPGLWVCLRDSRHKSYRVRGIEVQVTIPEDGDRWYGPIPEDKP